MVSKSARGLKLVPLAGVTLITWQAKLAELLEPSLLPLPVMLIGVNVGTTTLVGDERIKITVEVAEGSGVSVGRVGGMVGVNVSVGMAAEVCVEAALAVDTMIAFILFGSEVGYGVRAIAGTHAITNAIVASRTRSFVLRVDI